MDTRGFNPLGFAINLAIGWFFISFLQSAFHSLVAGKWDALLSRFQAIALFHDARAAVINVVIILVIGIVTNILWSQAHQR
ncbi:MAG TPA: hypothetical protein VMV44_11590 [Rectinemataceae bacterium]|nr:hypothetical protein [Rectinemataceae bacterium]